MTILPLWFLTVFLGDSCVGEVGRFWHITDIHYDQTYWTGGLSCNDNVTDPGKYGDYWCDSNWLLTQDTIAAMAQIYQNVDFVLWTGDNVAHIKQTGVLSLDVNIEIHSNLTAAFATNFQGIPVYASIGNNDLYPKDQAAAGEDEFYQQLADIWEQWLDNQTQVQLFEGGGFYMAMIQPKIRLLALNTNLFYRSNKLTENMTDPAGHLAWMEEQLEDAKKKREKVILSGHVPPGLLTPGLVDWFYKHYKPKFMEIVLRFSDIIVACHFGHDHVDSFKILQSEDGSKAVTQFTAPSVTPWRHKIPTETGVPHNPGIRLVEYDKVTGKQLNYHQYYINLTDSNSNGQTNWTKLYSFTDAYKVDDMTVSSLRQIFARLEKGGGQEYYQKYCRYARVSKYEQICTAEVQADIYCGGLHYDLEDAEGCKKKYLNAANEFCVNIYGVIGAIFLAGYVIRTSR